MQKILKISMLMAIVIIAIVGCIKNDDPKPPDEGDMQYVYLHGKVMNVDGKPLSSVTVTSGTANAVTAADGAFTLNQARVVDKRAVIKFERNGYFTLTRSGVKSSEMYMEVVLVAKGNSDITLQEEFEASEGATLKIGGMKVALPASAIKTADGSNYSGKVKTDMLYLEPNNGNFSDMMPGGDLAGIRTNGNEEMLVSYGMFDINLTDNNGNPLQLKGGNTSATVTFPIPAGMEGGAPSSMPLWHFDEQKGIWIEDGVATLQGGVYVGTVAHFSWVNCDHPEGVVKVNGLVVDCNDYPVPNAKVISGQTAIYTDYNGKYSGLVPANTPIKISVKAMGETYSVELPGQPAGSEVTVPTIKIPCMVTLVGRVLDCANKPVSKVLVHAGTMTSTTDNYGNYSIKVPENTPVTVSVTANGGSASHSLPGYPGGTTQNVPDLEVPCDAGWYPVKEGAIKFKKSDEIHIITIKDFGKKERCDLFYDDEENIANQNVLIINHINQTYWRGYGWNQSWYDNTYDEYERLHKEYFIDETDYAWALKGTKTVAGKQCNRYEFVEDDENCVLAVWKGMILFKELDDVKQFEAVAATDVVPDSAFEKTWAITWLK